MIVEKVYNLRDDINEMFLYYCDSELNLENASRFLLKFLGSEIVADTVIDPSLISGEFYNDGIRNGWKIIFNIGGISVPAGSYYASLIVYDAAHPNGQVLFHAENKTVLFKFIDPI